MQGRALRTRLFEPRQKSGEVGLEPVPEEGVVGDELADAGVEARGGERGVVEGGEHGYYWERRWDEIDEMGWDGGMLDICV